MPPLLICAAGAAVYSNTFAVPFHLDDKVNICDNLLIRTCWPPWMVLAQPRPVPQYTFALNYAVHGYEVWGYHLVNLVIHLTAALLLYGILRRTLSGGRLQQHYGASADGLALAIALIWTVHPLQTQAVTYIVQRHESLMGLFFLATLYTFIRAQEASRPSPWYLAAVAFCALGMASKEVMAAAPLLVLWYDRAFVSESWREIVARRKYFYIGLFATYAVLAWLMIAHRDRYEGSGLIVVEGLTPLSYLLSQSGVILHYLRLCFWPQGQCFDYGWPVARTFREIVPPGIVILALLAITVFGMFRGKQWSFLGGWFFLILAPTSSVVPIRDLAFEHRMYLPLAAVAALAVLGAYEVLCRTASRRESPHTPPAGGRVVALAVAAGLALAAHQRNALYATELSLWTEVTRKWPLHDRGFVWLGKALFDANRKEEARRATERALELNADNVEAHVNLGLMLMDGGVRDYARAHEQIARTLEIDPENALARQAMGDLLYEVGEPGEAVEQYRYALVKRPLDAEVRLSLAAALVAAGRPADAVAECRAVLADQPRSADAHTNLAGALFAMGKTDEALKHCGIALDFDPEHPQANAALGHALRDSDPKRALTHYEAALRAAPEAPEIHVGIGSLLAERDPVAAVKHFEAAIRLQPTCAEAHYNLGNLLAAAGRFDSAIIHLENAVIIRPDWTAAKKNLEILKRCRDEPGKQKP